MEKILSSISNSISHDELRKAEEYPVIINSVRHVKPNSLLAKIFMYLFPVGIILRLTSIPFDLRIINDLKDVRRLNGELNALLHGNEVSEVLDDSEISDMSVDSEDTDGSNELDATGEIESEVN